jgi:predicted membrane-bound spermidine synthase
MVMLLWFQAFNRRVVMDKTKKLSLLAPLSLNTTTNHLILYALFFCSGCSALIYQVMWERMLFTAFGVDLASITIIVSVFMFGLGMGGLCGGYLADLLPRRLLSLYICIELGIAVFGFASPWLIGLLGDALFSSSGFMTAIASFIILAIPTILMGATFPILVTHVNAYHQQVGRSVGSLYFANTLGGAAGAYCAGFILLYSLDVPASINRAAFLNLAIAVVAWMVFRRDSSC